MGYVSLSETGPRAFRLASSVSKRELVDSCVLWYNLVTMEQENKEFPQHLEQPNHEFAAPENSPMQETEGFIVELQVTEAEKQEIAEQLAEQQPVAPTIQEVKAAAVERAQQQEEIDKAHEHLQKDNDIETSGDAYEMINDLMNN